MQVLLESTPQVKESQLVDNVSQIRREVSILFPRAEAIVHMRILQKMFEIFLRKMIDETSKVPLVSTDAAQFSKAFETRMAVE